MNKAGIKSGTTSTSQLQKKQIQGLKRQLELLSQFIVRLSKHYEGVSPHLDVELQNLRSHLARQSNISMAEVTISKLTGLLMESVDDFRKHSSKAINALERAVRQLQTRESLNDDIKQEATSFLLSLKGDSVSLFASLPHFETALDIYNRALDNMALKRMAQQKTNADSVRLTISDKLHEEITEELRELIGQLSLTNKNDKQLKEVKDLLIRGIDHEELLRCCLIILKAIIRDVVKERKHAEKFVSGLHKSLSKVNDTVGKSIDDAEVHYQKKLDANSSLREQITGIEQAVDTSKDLNELKEKASQYVARMSESLSDREQADSDEQKVLLTLLTEMQTQLTALEKETSEYKNRLLEQQFHTHHDALTQVPNRTAYNERMDLEYRRWKRHGNALCLALIDVDHFKKINDNYGHAGGDKTLQVIAQNINRCLRATDFLARWGGEEFIILFPETSFDDLHKPLEAIRRQVERIPFKFKEKKVTITVSIGASIFNEGDTVEAVFERADRALYEAKNSGRNRIIVKQA